MKPCSVPSYSSSQEELHFLLSNQSYRKLYNLVINSCRKYNQSNAKSWFLQKLIDESIIPNSFKVKNKLHNTTSDAATRASLDWMKVTLEDNKKADKDLLEKLVSNMNKLLATTPDDLLQAVRNKVHKRGYSLQQHYKEENLAKLEN